MAEYKLKALSLTIGGKTFRKKDNPVFDTKIFGTERLESAAEAGFLELIESKAEAKAKAEAEAKKSNKQK